MIWGPATTVTRVRRSEDRRGHATRRRAGRARSHSRDKRGQARQQRASARRRDHASNACTVDPESGALSVNLLLLSPHDRVE